MYLAAPQRFCTTLAAFVTIAIVMTCGAYAAIPASTGHPEQNAGEAAPIQPPSLLAKFDSTVDAKTAKAGEPVAAKTTKELKLADLDIPKGSKLVGIVTSVQSMHEGGGDSILGVRFDRVELKDEKILRIRGLIIAIGPTPSNETGLGYDSVLSRGGVGSDPTLDPSIGADKYRKDNPELTKGSTLEGIALATRFDADGATLIRGVHRDVKLNSDVSIRVALFRSK
jgi:hypothetical protein